MIGFPAFGAPHVEFYKPQDVSNAGALGYMDVANNQISANNCSSVADSAMAFVAGATPQTTPKPRSSAARSGPTQTCGSDRGPRSHGES